MKLIVLLVAALVVGGCDLGRSASPVIDGIRIGPVTDCGGCDRPQTAANCGTCESVAGLARRGFDEKWPGHPPIVALSFHEEGHSPGPSGELIVHGRSGSLIVAVADFTDGTRHALGVHCGVGGCLVTPEYLSDR
jgi:hypothetical protein